MADSAVAITAGSGTQIDTRTEATNGNHRQVVVLGDPSTNAGVAPVDASLGLSVKVTNQTAGSGTIDSTTQRVVLASDSPGVVTLGQAARSAALPVTISDINSGEYETVAASATDQALGATGATGDYLMGLLVVPASTSPGAVSIKDGSGSGITVFAGGASSVSNLVPFFVPLGIYSTGGAWKVTTGSNVSAIGIGNFT